MQKSKVTSIRDPRHTLSLFTVLLLAPLAVRSAEIPQVLDEGLYFDVPSTEVAYNVQIIRLTPGGYATVYHGEPSKMPGLPGDAVDQAAMEWTLTFRNAREKPTVILEKISAVDTEWELTGSSRLRHSSRTLSWKLSR